MRCYVKNSLFLFFLSIFLYGNEKKQTTNCSFSAESVSSSNYPSLLPRPKGEIVDALSWNDSTGTNLIVISSYKKGAPLEKGYASEIYACQFHIKDAEYDTVWKIKDFSYTDAQVEYASGTLKLIDIDIDGIAESSFFYTISSNDRQVTKSILHTKGKKLAIRGYYTIFDSGEEPREDSLVVDQAFKKVNKMFREFAEEEWNTVTE